MFSGPPLNADIPRQPGTLKTLPETGRMRSELRASAKLIANYLAFIKLASIRL